MPSFHPLRRQLFFTPLAIVSWAGNLIVTLGVLVWTLLTGRSVPLNTMMIALSVPLLISFVHLGIVINVGLKLRKRLREHNNLLCYECHYALDRSAPAGSCPECGTAYTHREVRSAWTIRSINE